MESQERRRFITESMDSRHVPLDSFAKASYRHHFLRLRLNVAARILLGHQIIVPQGWAMDSLPLFQVISEISDCLESIFAEQGRKHELRNFSPFIRESHVGDLSYVDMLLLYLNRDDCFWAGLPPLLEKTRRENLRDDIAAAVKERRLSAASFQSFAETCLAGHAAEDTENTEDTEDVAKYWAGAFSYFSGFRERDDLVSATTSKLDFHRRDPIVMPEKAYRGNVELALKAAAASGTALDDPALRDIALFGELLAQHPGTQSTSKILFLAKDVVNPDAKDAILHISTFAQIWAAAGPAGAAASGPAISADAPPGLLLGNNLLKTALLSTDKETGITLRAELDEKLAAHLDATTDWRAIWKGAMLLSADPKWKELRRQFNDSFNDPNRGLDYYDRFDKLVDMLKASCPDLVLEQTAAERIGLKFSDAVMRKVAGGGKVLADMAAAAVAAATAPHVGLEFPIYHATVNILARPLIGWTARKVEQAINPLVKGNFLSSTATIFEISDPR